MGSGFSTCTGPSAVAVRRSVCLNRPLSDVSKLQHRPHTDNENNNEVSLDDLERHFFESWRDSNPLRCMSSRPTVRRQEIKDPFKPHSILKPHQHSIPSLASFTITEEEEFDKAEYRKRQSAKHLSRPKSANVRKRRNTKSVKSNGSGILEKSRRTDTNDDEFSDLSDSSDFSQSDFDDDVISIPDETQNTPGRDEGAVKLGPQFVVDNNDECDWWETTDVYEVKNKKYEATNPIMKKASERSISSIILTPIELSTNTECFPLTNDDEIQRIRQKIEFLEDALWEKLKSVANRDVRDRYEAIIKSSRSQIVKLLSEFYHTDEDVVCDIASLNGVDRRFAERLKERHSTVTRSEFSMMVADYLQAVEGHIKLESDVERHNTPRANANQHGIPSRHCKSAPHAESTAQIGCCMERKGSFNESRFEEGRRRGIIDEARSLMHSQWTSITYRELTKLIGVVRDVIANVRSCSKDLASLLNEDFSMSLTEKDVVFVNRYLEARRLGKLTKDEATASFIRHLTDMHQHDAGKVKQQQQHQLQQQQYSIQQINSSIGRQRITSSTGSDVSRPITEASTISTSYVHTNMDEKDSKSTKSRPDSGVVVSSSASYSSSDAAREDIDVCTDTSWITASLDMLDTILQVRTEEHTSIKSLTDAITSSCTTVQLKVHAIYRWLASQSLRYYSKAPRKGNSPTEKLRALADGKTSYATLFQEMARTAGLKCEKIDGFAKNKDYLPGSSMKSSFCQHTWNAVLLDGQYRLLDVQFASLPYKFFTEHFFMTPPDEFRLSHFPKDRRWLLMSQSISLVDFEDTVKTWPAMFAFNIRPLSMKSTIRTFDGKLSITVLLQNVAVTPHLQYDGPGKPVDIETLAQTIDTEIRSMDSAETFHMTLPREGFYYFTLLVHDFEEDEDIPAFQYRLEYKDELL